MRRLADLLDAYIAEMRRLTRDLSGVETVRRARAAVDAEVAALGERAERWEAWALHQEWCRWCAEDSPRNCSDGAVLWARCHVNDSHEPTRDDARRIVQEHDPEAARSAAASPTEATDDAR